MSVAFHAVALIGSRRGKIADSPASHLQEAPSTAVRLEVQLAKRAEPSRRSATALNRAQKRPPPERRVVSPLNDSDRETSNLEDPHAKASHNYDLLGSEMEKSGALAKLGTSPTADAPPVLTRCREIRIPHGLAGHGFFPRVYDVSLQQTTNTEGRIAVEITGFSARDAEAKPFLDSALRQLYSQCLNATERLPGHAPQFKETSGRFNIVIRFRN